MLQVMNLSKVYDNVPALNGVSFEAKAGEVTILLGPNGAGKSTAIKCICGLLRYTGNIQIGGYSNKTPGARRILSYVPETPALYEMLTVYEHLEFISKVYNVSGFQEKAQKLMERFELAELRDKLGKELSKGMQQKVSLSCGLLTEPKVIFLDEPMIGLDPKAIKELKATIGELRDKGTSVFISTHIIDSIEELWDRVIILKKGKVASDITRDQLTRTGESLESLFFRITEGG